MLELYIRPLSELPIKISDFKTQNKFIEIVERIIRYKRENKNTTFLEKQIDEMVYKLYELTDEEIAIVEGKNV